MNEELRKWLQESGFPDPVLDARILQDSAPHPVITCGSAGTLEMEEDGVHSAQRSSPGSLRRSDHRRKAQEDNSGGDVLAENYGRGGDPNVSVYL